MSRDEVRFLQAPRRCPWKDWSEWQAIYALTIGRGDVREDLFAQLRQVGGVPTAVTASQQLIACLHRKDDDMLRLATALVIVRAINMLADSLQQGQYASSIAELAGRLGVPRWLVDIRHESTHGQLPSSRTLALAARTLLEFLQVRYWAAQHQRLLDSGVSRPSLPSLRERVHSNGPLSSSPIASPSESAWAVAVLRRPKVQPVPGSARASKRRALHDVHALAALIRPLVLECSECAFDDEAFSVWTHARKGEWSAILDEGQAGIRAALAEIAMQSSQPSERLEVDPVTRVQALLRLTAWLCSTAVWRGVAVGGVAVGPATGPVRARMRASIVWPEKRLSAVVSPSVLLGLSDQHTSQLSVDVSGGGFEFAAYTMAACGAHNSAEAVGQRPSSTRTRAEQRMLHSLAFAAVPHVPRIARTGAESTKGKVAGRADAIGSACSTSSQPNNGGNGLELDQFEALLGGFDSKQPVSAREGELHLPREEQRHVRLKKEGQVVWSM